MNQTTSSMYNKLFIGGDLSGIQKFLYNITSKKAAVSLKGRSAYLRQYMEDVCARLTKLPEVASSQPDVIYCSGGKFYVIADNSDSVQTSLQGFSNQVKKEIWQKHQGQLSINLSWVPYSENPDGSINANSKSSQELGFLWLCLTEDFARQKNQKFLDQIKVSFEDFFEVKAVGGKPKVCAVTGIESNQCVSFSYNGEEPITVLPSVREQILLGEKLRDKEKFHTFEEYAGDSYLGILRMDVDGLGKMFANGFPTLDEYKFFSSRLDSYFTNRPGHNSNLQQIQQKPDYREYLNLIYAGGDDIFAVGRWDKVIDFAAEVRKDFVEYVNTEGVSISGGIAIVNPKFPIAKAAELAGEAEDTAKDYVYHGKPKNAFCMFGKAISWQDEFDYVKQYKEEFVDMINHFDMPRGILHRIMSYAAIIERNESIKAKKKTPNYSYIWHSAYYLTRMIERQKNNKMVVEFCKRLRDKELYGQNGNFRLMAIAARWAELTIRMNQN